VNGDGYADVLIGASNANSAAGYTYVYFGHKNSANTPWPNPNYVLSGL